MVESSSFSPMMRMTMKMTRMKTTMERKTEKGERRREEVVEWEGHRLHEEGQRGERVRLDQTPSSFRFLLKLQTFRHEEDRLIVVRRATLPLSLDGGRRLKETRRRSHRVEVVCGRQDPIRHHGSLSYQERLKGRNCSRRAGCQTPTFT